VIAAIIIITEKRLPAAISERVNVPRISGRAIPRVATIIDGMKLEHGTIKIEARSRRAEASGFAEAIRGSYLNGRGTPARGLPRAARLSRAMPARAIFMAGF
jgi:hypothetical protein